MAWPTDAVVTGDPVTSAQLNGLPVRIADTTLTGSASSISFTSIPQHYAHLVIVAYLRDDFAGTTSTVNLNINSSGDDIQRLYGSAATATAQEIISTGVAMLVGNIPGNTAGANLFGGVRIVIPHYGNTANNKVAIARSATKSGTASGSMRSHLAGAFRRANDAVTSVALLPGGANLVAGSRATLYGYP